jgi:nitrate reductase cytochrome c-type subunit
MLWNRTTPGFNGPWLPQSNNINACLYCHGNQNPANTNVAKVLHKAVSLGRSNVAFLDNGMVINGTIDSSSFYCSQCHYPGNSNRSDIVSAFEGDGWEAPVDNTNATGQPPGFFDHTGSLAAGFSDDICEGCHGSLLSDGAKMDEFVHKVGVGAGGPDCKSCHDIGQTGAPKHVDYSALRLGVHNNLNNRSTDPGVTSDSTGGDLSENYACWACHQSDGTEPDGMGDIFQTPWTCPDCHLQDGANNDTYSSAPTVVEHFKAGEDIQAATDNATVVLSCKECHNKDEMILPNVDPEDGTFDADGDGIFGGQQNYYHYGKPRPDIRDVSGFTDCDYCHLQWM